MAVRNATKTYELGGTVTALDDVSLQLSSGSYTAVMGPSGSGKSTLLNLIGGLDTADAGRVTVAGADLGRVSERHRAAMRGTEIGFVFQTFNLMPRLTATENVALPLVFDGWNRTDRIERAHEVLDGVGLDDRYEHTPTELSGGQRQRVAVARALAPEPSILLADEPTGNVDTDTGASIMSLLSDVHAAGNTILLVTHARRIAEHADRIVHVRDGRIEGVEQVTGSRPTASAVPSGTSDTTAGDGTSGTTASGDTSDTTAANETSETTASDDTSDTTAGDGTSGETAADDGGEEPWR